MLQNPKGMRRPASEYRPDILQQATREENSTHPIIPMSIVYARGIKVSRDQLNELLIVNNVDPILGGRTGGSEEENIATFFRSKGIDLKIRIFIPPVNGYNCSPWTYICDTWDFIFSQRRVGMPPKEPALDPIFEDLRQMLQVETPIDRYILYCGEQHWAPEEIVQRFEVGIEDLDSQVYTNNWSASHYL